MAAFYFLLCVFGFLLLHFSAEWVIKGVGEVARFLKWREFIVSFFVMAIVASLPNFFIGTISSINKIPELSLGDIIGGNIIDLTLVVALAVFLAKKELVIKSKVVQKSAFFTAAIAILPFLLILDKKLSRLDGIFLWIIFIFYNIWLFSKKHLSQEIPFEKEKKNVFKEILNFFLSLKKIIFGSILCFLASFLIVKSMKFFSENFNVSFLMLGFLPVAFGNCLPEIYFSILAVRKKENWMFLGNLMGAVVGTSTFVLGTVALFSPFEIKETSAVFFARLFLLVSALFFALFLKTESKITKKEAIFLLFVYFLFLFCESKFANP